jgi:hypothetical protein
VLAGVAILAAAILEKLTELKAGAASAGESLPPQAASSTLLPVRAVDSGNNGALAKNCSARRRDEETAWFMGFTSGREALRGD